MFTEPRDATETPIERPKKTKILLLRKKEKTLFEDSSRCSEKIKIVICAQMTKGRRHDFKLFQESRLKIPRKTQVLTDTGYQGKYQWHKNYDLPRKRSKKNPLTQEQRLHNQIWAQNCIANENVGA